MKKTDPTILIVKYRALGDSVMGLSTISYLRSIYPNSKIYYGVRGWTSALYKNIKTDADEVIPLTIEGISDFFKILKLVKTLKIDHIHELHLSGRSQKIFKLISLVTGVKFTFHDHHKKAGEVLDQGVIKPLIQRDLDGVYTYLGSGTTPSFLDYEPRFKNNTKNIESTEKIKRVILGVVATRETKMWDLENYVKLSNLIKEFDQSIEVVAPLSNSLEDKKIEEKIISCAGNNIKIVRIPLADIPKYFHESTLYVGNDTGLKHIAIACGIKSFTLFGPEPTLEWHPYNELSHPYFYIDGLDCRTRTAHYCGLNTCDSMICMKQITVENVFSKIKLDLVK